MGLFFYTKKGSIISTVDLPTTEIIEPLFVIITPQVTFVIGEFLYHRKLLKISLTSSIVSARETAPRILAAPAVPRR